MSSKQHTKKGNQQGYNNNNTSRMKGDEEGLGYNVFDYGKANNQNQYNKTFEAIISHIVDNGSLSADVQATIGHTSDNDSLSADV